MDVCGAHAPHTSIFPVSPFIENAERSSRREDAGVFPARLKVEDAECSSWRGAEMASDFLAKKV